MTTEKLSPGMQQYVDIKKQYPDAFLLFRMGDFYELFYEDAVNAAQILEISLTSRNKNAENPIPMAGVPITLPNSILTSSLNVATRLPSLNRWKTLSKLLVSLSARLFRSLHQGQWLIVVSQIVTITF